MKKKHFFKHKAQDFKSTVVVGSYLDKLGNVFFVVYVDVDGESCRIAFKNLSSVVDFLDCNLSL